MRTPDVTSLRARLLVAAGALTAVSIHGATSARATSAPETVCLPPEADGACPADADALDRIAERKPDDCPELAEAGATKVDGQCCYEVRYDCSARVVGCSFSGGAWRIEERPRAEGARLVTDWHDPDLPRPEVGSLSRGERRLAALHWARVGAAEHLSIAGFQRFARDLQAHGAPPALLAAARRAAMDESRHARLAFTLASVFAGVPIGPSTRGRGVDLDLDLGGDVDGPPRRSLGELALATAQEGCTVETLSACLLDGALRGATDPVIAAVLRRMRGDEERHAALAWGSLRWMLSRDPRMATAVHAAMERAIEGLSAGGFGDSGGPARVGVLHPEDAEACREVAIGRLLRPCRDLLFDGI